VAKATKKPSKVTMDRRASTERRQKPTDRRQKSEEVVVERRATSERRKVARRRQIDPTTCERDYTGDEVEFMQAMDEYKRRNGRMFPTCSEILEVVRDLGYSKTESPAPAADENGLPVAFEDAIESASAADTDETYESEED
jgi:hypothetical protein